MFRGRVHRIHFLGIGGIGMSGLAEILASFGFAVSGSDLKETETTRRLAELGIKVSYGHQAEFVQGADVVVYSSAVKEDNPEVRYARHHGIPVIRRAEMLAELMRLTYNVTVAGSHGKTTTTSLIATTLRRAGLDPTAVVGGQVNSLGSNVRIGGGNLFVAEADESDGSFLKLTPTIAVITNIDPEHLDHYGTYDCLLEAFVQYGNKAPFYGLAVLCSDHPGVQRILPSITSRKVTYGFGEGADYTARNLCFSGAEVRFEGVHQQQSLGEFVLRLPGKHNVLNALATLAVADELEIPFDVLRESLAEFHGVQRRFTVVGQPRLTRGGQSGDVLVVDDYGHHPAEVEATLEAARAFSRRVVVVFQPHRFTRTQALLSHFATAFHQADLLFVTEVYPAGEDPIPGATGADLARAVQAQGHPSVTYVADKQTILAQLLRVLSPHDLVIVLGAGDIQAVAYALHTRLLAEGPCSG